MSITNKNQTGLRKGKIKVLLVDDHPILRKGLGQLINHESDMMICGEAEDSPKAFELVGTLSPDVMVVDVSLKGGNGIELIKNVKARYPELPILVLSMHDESLYAERALRAGSLGYIMKEEAIEQVLVAIRRVITGEIFLSDKMKSRMLQQLASGGRAKGISNPIENLTDRELEVFRMIGEGRSTRQIAGELHLSVRTVEAYREYIKGKLNLKNSTELVQHAFHWVHHEAAA
ncbi:MAG: two component transcriptional regulator, LuxR family [Verrucomicrobiales bacterium]|jgi:DNA-binding NarL/FixJ family response regulator|nr:two component transcriptional regulator, LuxR family [Verrucomicrobiales bacterium]